MREEPSGTASEWEWEYFESDEEGPCMICAKPTNRLDFDFHTSVCSETCIEALWAKYWEAQRALGPPSEWECAHRSG